MNLNMQLLGVDPTIMPDIFSQSSWLCIIFMLQAIHGIKSHFFISISK